MSERPPKERVIRLAQRYVINPLMKAALATNLLPPTHALLETKGRKSGQPRTNPVGNGLSKDGRTFWIVAEHGRRAGYIRNIEADPRVRFRIRKRWYTGVATLLPDDDPHARLRAIGRPINGAMVRAAGTDLLTVRIDVEGEP